MELVSEEFVKMLGVSSNFELIKRVKDTKPQYKLSKIQRKENLFDAFKVDTSKDLHKSVLILDDICSSGSTFEEMIRTLKNAGITDIVCLSASNP